MTATPESRPGGEIVVYETSNGEVALNVRLEQETVWLTRGQMAAVFASTSENIRQHLRNIFVDGELEESATTKDFLLVRSEGDRRVRRRIRHYNLDVIISVGYRVNSKSAVRFRQWATTPTRGGCCLNTTRIASRLPRARGRRPPPSITNRRLRRSRNSVRR